MFDSFSQAATASACNLAAPMYSFMEDQIVLNSDNCSFVTYAR